MKLRPDTLALTATLAMLTALGPLSTDMYLPSLPAIGLEFATTPARVQLTLSAFLIGFALGQIIYGPVSDRMGRKPVLFAGLLIFALASILCATATSVDMLIVGRVLQALGAASPIVLARAMVRDVYEGARAGRELSRMGTIMGLVPALAPILGSVIQTYTGWRMTFWLTLCFALALLALVMLRLPETLRVRSPEPLSFLNVLRGYGRLLQQKSYRVHVALAALTYSGLFAFISASSFVLQGVYGLSEIAFAFAFALMVMGYIAGTILSQRLLNRLDLQGVIKLGVCCLAMGGVLMIAGVASRLATSFVVTVPMMIYALGVGLTLPQVQAAAMEPFPDTAGAASSLLGICQMTLAALVGIAVGHALGGSAWPLAITEALIGCCALAVFAWGRMSRLTT
jgi:MFS transporter, DHA1 family, multidrug resistance protein